MPSRGPIWVTVAITRARWPAAFPATPPLVFAVRPAPQLARLLASHDDDSAADIDRARALGVTIAEFPMSVEAATAARKVRFSRRHGRSQSAPGGARRGAL